VPDQKPAIPQPGSTLGKVRAASSGTGKTQEPCRRGGTTACSPTSLTSWASPAPGCLSTQVRRKQINENNLHPWAASAVRKRMHPGGMILLGAWPLLSWGRAQESSALPPEQREPALLSTLYPPAAESRAWWLPGSHAMPRALAGLPAPPKCPAHSHFLSLLSFFQDLLAAFSDLPSYSSPGKLGEGVHPLLNSPYSMGGLQLISCFPFFSCSFSFFFFSVSGIECKASHLLSKYSTT
jgi:hypothetical protein